METKNEKEVIDKADLIEKNKEHYMYIKDANDRIYEQLTYVFFHNDTRNYYVLFC